MQVAKRLISGRDMKVILARIINGNGFVIIFRCQGELAVEKILRRFADEGVRQVIAVYNYITANGVPSPDPAQVAQDIEDLRLAIAKAGTQ